MASAVSSVSIGPVSAKDGSQETTSGNSNSELGGALREADSETLHGIVVQNLAVLSTVHVRQILRNPFVTSEIIDCLITAQHLLSAYEVRKLLVSNPQTREIQALRLVGGLYWRDLATIALAPVARPRIRRAAELQLLTRLPSLALGERISLARLAGPNTIQQLGKDSHPRVIQALLENPRMTEADIVPLVGSPATAGQVLALIARSPRWGSRYSVKLALARNRAAPPETALVLLPSLKRVDLKAVASDRALAQVVRERADRLLGAR